MCHCAVCQQVHGTAFADTTVVPSSAIAVEDPDQIVFERRRAPPFSVQCGTCRCCARPVVGYTTLLGLVKLALIPVSLYQEPDELETARAHLFYRRRTADVGGDLPKYSSFLASELAFGVLVIAGLAVATGPRPAR
jgi:hypothetical protein